MNAHRLTRFLAGAAIALISYAVPAFEIYQLPMFATGAATPNVMLLVDTSGSMNNIIWADGFNIATTYADWSSEWDPNDGNVYLGDLVRGSCGSGYKRGIKGAVTRCLKLPDPVGSGNTRYDGNYLNYLFQTYGTPGGFDLTTTSSPIPHGSDDTRMKVAKTVAKDLVDTVTGVRFGVARFDTSGNDQGAEISENCDDPTSGHLTAIKSTIDGYTAQTNTPLAESLYEITRYFRGMSPFYYSGGNYTSPLQYRCQKNFTIVLTDGFPTWDNKFPNPNADSADNADSTHSLPNWDGQPVPNPDTTSSAYPIFPPHSDGFKPTTCPGIPYNANNCIGQGSEGYSLYLDDIAKFGYDIDMKTTGNDDDGVSWNDPEFPKQNMTTYAVGFATGNQMMEDAAAYSGGQYFTAKNAADLKEALEQVLLDIQNKATAAASVSLNSTRLDANTLIYQASFDSADWSGDLQAFPVDVDTGAVLAKVWSAKDHVPAAASRTIVTQKSSPRVGIAATWANLSSGQQSALNTLTDPPSCSTCSCLFSSSCRNNCSKCGGGATNGPQVLDYLLGVRSGEEQYGGTFRDRSTVLGDIVNSDPLFVGKPNFGYHTLPGSEGTSYVAFRASSAYTGRPPMVYVGANDGMLHAIDGSEAVADGGGTERFAYMPLTLFPKLKELTKPSYSHRFYVNGSPQSGDAYLNGAWKTVLVGTLGAGGRGVFALDITDPESFGPSKVLWEKTVTGDTNINITDDADLGFTYGQASIGRMANDKWAAIVGNGYNSDNKRAVLFIFDLETGAILKKIDTGVGSAGTPVVDNGLSTPVIVDANNDKIVDYIYAGDMLGNMWKFDVTATSAGSWDVAYKSGSTNTPLYTALDPSGNPQPITVKPVVTRRSDGDLMVLFGTGKYFEAQDRSVPASPTPQVQTFYGVRDPGGPVGSGHSTLVQQSVIVTTTFNGASDGEETTDSTDSDDSDASVRVTTAARPTSSTQNGWYLNLPTAGERQVSRPVLRTGRIIFTTVIPNSDSCSAGGTSWLMEVDALTGGRLPFSPFDLNYNGKFTETVLVMIDGEPTRVPVSGLQSDVGVMGTPGIAQEGNREFKYISGSSGGISVTLEPGDIGAGRQSWRQLQ
ncbi:MAG: hypothetical protein H5U26_10470 [Immundisolibacter sp.]|uniref:pilus assembly protein n=1 Tax=Immundisolibacter sp. TaxID=1934948 RepID=UPI001988B392|nr:PilC/PilY family type IV pilus protein [Immundisolibacter sp.]MBC7162514.1 hypothetical protein [Immundisolibacter sp.]